MIPRDFHFGSYESLWHLLWLFPILGLFLYTFTRRRKLEDLLVQEPLRKSVILTQDIFWRGVKAACFCFGWIFAVISLLEPIGNEYYQSKLSHAGQKESALDLFLLIDVSQSMAVTDGRNKKMRLEIAEEIADLLVARLKVDPVALFAFTSELIPIVPLTYDRTFLRLALRDIQFNEENHFGTNYAEIFKQLSDRMAENHPKAKKAILLFSDGGDTVIEGLRGETQKMTFESLLNQAQSLKIPIFSIGIGSKEGGEVPDVLAGGKNVVSRLNESMLMALSENTGGKYFSAENQTAEEIAGKISRTLEQTRSEGALTAISSGVFHQYFQVPLAFSLIFFVLYWFMPRFKSLLIPLLLFSSYSFAANPGESLYESGKYAEASSWYLEELKSLPPEWLRNKLLYNFGTSLMAESKWKDAEIAYFAISKEAYSYPLFRLRLIYNQVLGLIQEAEKSADKALLLQNALSLLQLASSQKCEGCPEEVFADLKEELKMRLTQADIETKTKIENPIASLDAEIRLLRLAARLPNQKGASLDGKALELEQVKLKQATTPAFFLRTLIDELAIASSLRDVENQAKSFYPFVFAWQKKQFAEGVCQCHPWNAVFPLFTEGLKVLRLDPFETQGDFAYNKWVESLKLLEQSPHSTQTHESNLENDDIQELREMQALDKVPGKAKMKAIGEGMPW